MTPPVSEFGEIACAGLMAFSGVGEEAKEIDSSLFQFRQEVFADSISLAQPKAAVFQDLEGLVSECSVLNWDGYGALGLSAKVLTKARAFLSSLPNKHIDLELSATPEGDVAFDWFYAKRHSLTLLIGEQSRLVYAAIDGDEEYSGTASFVDEAPRSILRTLDRLSSYSVS